MNQIAVIDTGYDSYDYEIKLFQEHGYRLIIYDGPARDRKSQLDFAREASGILVRGTAIDIEALDQMPHLKAIVRYGAGYDNIDIKAVAGKGIRVANVQGYANHSVSDHAIALMFACIRNLGKNNEHTFGKPSRKEVFELHNKTLGIIGIGRIGSHFSRKTSALFERTLAYDPYKTAKYIQANNAVKTNLPELLNESHVISLHCNLTDETRHILSEPAFLEMQNKPVIINTSRGPTICEKDLLKALDSGAIHSAGLDVYEKEPPGKDQELLLQHPQVISTPHIAWYSDRASHELQKKAADNMLALLSGKRVDDELH
ncbi:MAG: hypothetical protein KAT15_31955 [Bacteroidales bacterium]|nr:hypothetical protein [Bacteroidales bacterium]